MLGDPIERRFLRGGRRRVLRRRLLDQGLLLRRRLLLGRSLDGLQGDPIDLDDRGFLPAPRGAVPPKIGRLRDERPGALEVQELSDRHPRLVNPVGVPAVALGLGVLGLARLDEHGDRKVILVLDRTTALPVGGNFHDALLLANVLHFASPLYGSPDHTLVPGRALNGASDFKELGFSPAFFYSVLLYHTLIPYDRKSPLMVNQWLTTCYFVESH